MGTSGPGETGFLNMSNDEKEVGKLLRRKSSKQLP